MSELCAGVVHLDETDKHVTKIDEWTANVKMENKDIKRDTGAQANVILFSLLKKAERAQTMKQNKIRLSTYTEQKIAVKRTMQSADET